MHLEGAGEDWEESGPDLEGSDADREEFAADLEGSDADWEQSGADWEGSDADWEWSVANFEQQMVDLFGFYDKADFPAGGGIQRQAAKKKSENRNWKSGNQESRKISCPHFQPPRHEDTKE